MPSLIDFWGEYGAPYAVYEAERDGRGETKILRSIFKPHPAQVEFLSAPERHVLMHGNRGCGKSASLLWKAIQTAYLLPGCRVAIFRKTWPELKRSLWDEMLKLPTDLYQDLNLSEHTVTIKARDLDGWSPRIAKAETTAPPTKKRMIIWIIAFLISPTFVLAPGLSSPIPDTSFPKACDNSRRILPVLYKIPYPDH
jgi:hypothetical protein